MPIENYYLIYIINYDTVEVTYDAPFTLELGSSFVFNVGAYLHPDLPYYTTVGYTKITITKPDLSTLVFEKEMTVFAGLFICTTDLVNMDQEGIYTLLAEHAQREPDSEEWQYQDSVAISWNVAVPVLPPPKKVPWVAVGGAVAGLIAIGLIIKAKRK